jgi:hypothetical protein
MLVGTAQVTIVDTSSFTGSHSDVASGITEVEVDLTNAARVAFTEGERS